uniref:Uncharacterized protein n=1 Tax=Zea mays TaxID=4577 RepID=B6UCP7_MAIZE|nr:hypothetical protein [Zea mays]
MTCLKNLKLKVSVGGNQISSCMHSTSVYQHWSAREKNLGEEKKRERAIVWTLEDGVVLQLSSC